MLEIKVDIFVYIFETDTNKCAWNRVNGLKLIIIKKTHTFI
jgi:hypothetical protein